MGRSRRRSGAFCWRDFRAEKASRRKGELRIERKKGDDNGDEDGKKRKTGERPSVYGGRLRYGDGVNKPKGRRAARAGSAGLGRGGRQKVE